MAERLPAWRVKTLPRHTRAGGGEAGAQKSEHAQGLHTVRYRTVVQYFRSYDIRIVRQVSLPAARPAATEPTVSECRQPWILPFCLRVLRQRASAYLHISGPFSFAQFLVVCPSFRLEMSAETQEEYEARMEREERQALGRIVHSIRQYEAHASWEVSRWERNFAKLPPQHKSLLTGFSTKCKTAKDCIRTNSMFFKAMLGSFDTDEGNHPAPHLADANQAAVDYANSTDQHVSAADMEKVNYVLKNLMRDWSEDGAKERAESYGRVIAELKSAFKGWTQTRRRDPPCVLVPGAGLGRLCLEIASLGFRCEGNEFSYYMLLASSFMMNQTVEANQWTIFPWVLCSNNSKSDADQMKAVPIPEVNPVSMVPGPGFLSMCGGDFVEVYSSPDYRGHFDCVATNFFIDTAHNVVEYLEIISSILKEGGYWINIGPLLFHWADSHSYLPNEEMSIEISLEDVKAIAAAYGLKCIREEFVPASYTSNHRALFQTTYTCAFWTMVKDSSTATVGQQQQPPQTHNADGQT